MQKILQPGMTNANMKLVIINVNVPASETKVPEPDQKLDQGEFIVKRVVALKELSNVLEGTFALRLHGSSGSRNASLTCVRRIRFTSEALFCS